MRAVSIFGMGYVGACVAGCLAKDGFKVIGVEVDDKKVNMLNSGVPPFKENMIAELLTSGIKEGKIRATKDAQQALLETEASLICVGTPSESDGSVNLNAVKAVGATLGNTLKNKPEYHLFVMRSTVPPGTCSVLIKIMEEYSGKECGKDFGFCMIEGFN